MQELNIRQQKHAQQKHHFSKHAKLRLQTVHDALSIPLFSFMAGLSNQGQT